jgi:hypothetical protein
LLSGYKEKLGTATQNNGVESKGELSGEHGYSSTQPGRITAENSSERQKALAKAPSAGVHFKVNGGNDLTSDGMLIGYELVEREEQISKLESRKKDAFLGLSRRNEYGQEVMN